MVAQGEVLMAAGRLPTSPGRVLAERDQRRSVGRPPVLADDVERILEGDGVPQSVRVRSPAEMGDVVPLGVLPALDVIADQECVVPALDRDDPPCFEAQGDRGRDERLRRIPDVAGIEHEGALAEPFGRDRVLKRPRPVVPAAGLVRPAVLLHHRPVGLVEPKVGASVGFEPDSGRPAKALRAPVHALAVLVCREEALEHLGRVVHHEHARPALEDLSLLLGVEKPAEGQVDDHVGHLQDLESQLRGRDDGR